MSQWFAAWVASWPELAYRTFVRITRRVLAFDGAAFRVVPRDAWWRSERVPRWQVTGARDAALTGEQGAE